MVYNEKSRISTNKHIRNNWVSKYKEYYHNKTMEWRENHLEEYRESSRVYMNKRNAYIRECKRLRNILFDYDEIIDDYGVLPPYATNKKG